jgi:threonylcarbamoyladenosine tRNA methylthiotransferase MtaB
VDAVLGNTDRNKIIEIINNAKTEKTMSVKDIKNEHIFERLFVSRFEEKTRAFIKIQEGCDNYCSYCIIPYARGPARSRNMSDISYEVKSVIASGHKEIILTGIHIASYGKDLNGPALIDLIERLDGIKGLERIRLGSIEPKLMDDKFLSRLSKLSKVCPSFHISLQSGCEKTLKNMNRKYTAKEYSEIISNTRNHFPKCAVTTDIIVGFPAESEEDYIQSYEFCAEMKFMKIHVFPFSLKKGTAAQHIMPKIEKSVIQKRCENFLSLSNSLQDEFNTAYAGKTAYVLFEKNKANICEGYTDN